MCRAWGWPGREGPNETGGTRTLRDDDRLAWYLIDGKGIARPIFICLDGEGLRLSGHGPWGSAIGHPVTWVFFSY